jgi:hypothetical protein
MRPEPAMRCEGQEGGTVRPIGPLRFEEKSPVTPAADHGRRVLEIMRDLASRGRHVTLAAMAGSTRMQAWRHYPEHDADDPVNHTRFFYHAHETGPRWPAEHGHFHLFHVNRDGGVVHLLAISMTDTGLPVRLFLTNRWVTGEQWSTAEHCHAYLERFACFRRGRLAPVAAWVSAMVGLYRDDACRLHLRREQWLHARRMIDDQHDWLESRRHEVLVSCRIDLPQRLARLGLRA